MDQLKKLEEELIKLNYKEKEAEIFFENLDIIEETFEDENNRKNKKDIRGIEIQIDRIRLDIFHLVKYRKDNEKRKKILKEKREKIYKLEGRMKQLKLYVLEYKEKNNILKDEEKIEYLELKFELGLNE